MLYLLIVRREFYKKKKKKLSFAEFKRSVLDKAEKLSSTLPKFKLSGIAACLITLSFFRSYSSQIF